MKIHVAIVSDQILANLIPALMERPDKVVLAASPEMIMRGQDKRLAEALKRAGISCELLDSAPDVDIRNIHKYAQCLRDLLVEQYVDAQIVLNATGGTKPMSLGFVEVFRGKASRIIYTDTRHRRIEALPNGDADIPDPEPMRDVLDVTAYLAAQGLQVLSSASDAPDFLERMPGRKYVARYLAENATRLESFFRTMNAIADRALDKDGNLVAPTQALNYPPHPKSIMTEALNELAKAKCIGWTEGESNIYFIDAERTQFVRGGWLEEYAFHVVRSANPFDAMMGVRVCMEGGERTQNEFDVLSCYGNQLLFIECKALKFVEGQNDNELAYKLKSLGDAARGLFGETWLLSAQPPSATLKERARQARFKLIGPEELPKLRNAVLHWMKPTE